MHIQADEQNLSVYVLSTHSCI